MCGKFHTPCEWCESREGVINDPVQNVPVFDLGTYIQTKSVVNTTNAMICPVYRNRAKFHLSCVQRFGNRFGGGEGAAPYKATFSHLFLKKNLSEKTQELAPQVWKQVVNLSC